MLQVEITIKGELDGHWSEWLSDLAISHTESAQTCLTGTVADQAELYGLLTKLRNLGLALVAVKSEEVTLA